MESKGVDLNIQMFQCNNKKIYNLFPLPNDVGPIVLLIKCLHSQSLLIHIHYVKTVKMHKVINNLVMCSCCFTVSRAWQYT